MNCNKCQVLLPLLLSVKVTVVQLDLGIASHESNTA
jgi:hypothetical protein